MKNNDKKTKNEMNAEEMKAVSGGATKHTLQASPAATTPVAFQPVLPGGFRHW